MTVMLHSGVCMIRQYCAFAHMVYGQTATRFLRQARRETDWPRPTTCAHKRARIFHIHRRELYAAIGEPHSRFRKPTPIGAGYRAADAARCGAGSRDLTWLASERDKLAHFTVLLGTAVSSG